MNANPLPTVLTLNSGSSSLKASLFGTDGSRRDWRYGHIGRGFPHDHAEAFDALLNDLGDANPDSPDAIGHRFVHGGEVTDAARLLDVAEIERLRSITVLAPLHMPGNLLGVELCRARFDCPQFACFDTAFHHTLPELARRLPIPQSLGMRRYGFHGLNYAFIAARLPAPCLGKPRTDASSPRTWARAPACVCWKACSQWIPAWVTHPAAAFPWAPAGTHTRCHLL
jgi:acetate kinase